MRWTPRVRGSGAAAGVVWCHLPAHPAGSLAGLASATASQLCELTPLSSPAAATVADFFETERELVE